MRRNTKTIAGVGLIPTPRELVAVCRGRTFLDNISGVFPDHTHRFFEAVLETDGTITVAGHSWHDGFPSHPLGAVRNLAEGKHPLDPAKLIGGWLYWHYFDEITGEWENLEHLWQRATARALNRMRTQSVTIRLQSSGARAWIPKPHIDK